MKKKGILYMKSVMTPFPYTVDLDASIDEAGAMMEEHGIHHLPVADGGVPVGVISDRDLKWTKGSGLFHKGPPRVREVCRMDACRVELTDPVDKVLDKMIENHLGEVLVEKNGKLVGIMTMVDVCRGFADLLRDRYPSDPDPTVA